MYDGLLVGQRASNFGSLISRWTVNHVRHIVTIFLTHLLQVFDTHFFLRIDGRQYFILYLLIVKPDVVHGSLRVLLLDYLGQEGHLFRRWLSELLLLVSVHTVRPHLIKL